MNCIIEIQRCIAVKKSPVQEQGFTGGNAAVGGQTNKEGCLFVNDQVGVGKQKETVYPNMYQTFHTILSMIVIETQWVKQVKDVVQVPFGSRNFHRVL